MNRSYPLAASTVLSLIPVGEYTETIESDSIDLNDYDGAVVVVVASEAGSGADPECVVTLQESRDDGNADAFAAIDDAEVEITDDDGVLTTILIQTHERKRHVRAVATIDGAAADGATAEIATTVAGVAAVNAEHSITAVGGSAGTMALDYGDLGTVTLAYNADAASAQTAFDSGLGAGKTEVTGTTLPTGPLVVEFIGTLAAMPIALPDVDDALLVDGEGSVTSAVTGVEPVDEVQTLYLVAAQGGELTLTFDSDTTGPFSHDASVEAVQAVVDLAVGVGNIIVGGSDLPATEEAPMTFTYAGDLAGLPVPEMTADVDAVISEPLHFRLAVWAIGLKKSVG